MLDQHGRVKVKPREYSFAHALANHPIDLLLFFQGDPLHTAIGTRVTVPKFALPQREFPMPRSPSIVPHGVDHDVYLVLNDFGRQGALGAKLTGKAPTARRSSVVSWKTSIAIRCGSSPSIPPTAGRATLPSTSATSCAVALPSVTRCRDPCRHS